MDLDFTQQRFCFFPTLLLLYSPILAYICMYSSLYVKFQRNFLHFKPRKHFVFMVCSFTLIFYVKSVSHLRENHRNLLLLAKMQCFQWKNVCRCQKTCIFALHCEKPHITKHSLKSSTQTWIFMCIPKTEQWKIKAFVLQRKDTYFKTFK